MNPIKELFGLELKDYKRVTVRAYLLHMLSVCDFNVTKAAKLANVNRADFYKVMSRHDLDIDALRNPPSTALAPFDTPRAPLRPSRKS